jgi:hypothetical protein
MMLGCISVDTTFRIPRYWCAKNSMLIHGAPLRDVKVGAWMSAIETIGYISFCDHNSNQLVTHSLDTISFNICLITNEYMPFSSNTMHPLHHKPFSAPSLNMMSKNIITTLLKYTDPCLFQTGILAAAALPEVTIKSTSVEKHAGT